ncbi:protein mahjong-like isoform X2 [Macrosteles quadrilineatus]|nr:protein mahjong-like isoform X2 [Macrosteles quadrilineatus]XP_054289280.1 protein mahjong-like isoform X2 [Macrosteles quadrilineatus]
MAPSINDTNNETADVQTLLRQWEEEHHAAMYDPVPLLTRLAELIEAETDNYNKMDPDPFDERHPNRADPNCALGHMLKVLFRKDSFMNKLVNDYLRENYYARSGITGRDINKLNVVACRLMIDILPGLETSAVFESPTNDALVQRLFSWAEKSSEPLQTYATGLLAAAMEVQDIAAAFREQNGRLVPLMLERLHALQSDFGKDKKHNSSRPFAHLNNLENGLVNHNESTPKKRNSSVANLSPPPPDEISKSCQETPSKMNGPKKPSESEVRRKSVEAVWEPPSPLRPGLMSPPHTKPSPFHISDCSNSSWAELEPFVIGNVQMYPPTLATRQYFILKYLTPMGEYQEFLSHVFEKNALDLILQIMNLRDSRNSRLSFEALKYLAALLCHKKFSIEFINMQGLQRLLEVPRPSIAATGVSICLYYLAYCEDAMERVCLLPHHILADLVSYSLWLLECSHDSGRCHATMFFGLSFQFRVILEEFDRQDGLRKLYNVMSTLPILAVEDDAALNEDEECSARQIVRHVCVALKRYLEAHLHIKAENLRRLHMRENTSETSAKMPATLPPYKAYKSSPEEVAEQINTLLDLMTFRASWQPVDELIRLGGITLLLQVIAFAYEWNYSGRAETVRSALEVLGICAVMPQVQLLLCERVDLPDEVMTVGLNVILGAAEGEIVADPDVQRAALGVLITCVCAPIVRVGGMIAKFSSSGSVKKRTSNVLGSEEVIEKMWDCVRSNNGIMVLLTLMMVKTPITDADSIRGLACRALVGLARSETVRQIISKLPLFSNGLLQNLMRDPILQDKRQEHVMFQKYALELMERVSGKSKPNGNELEVSLQNIHRANVIAQTHIQFNEQQLFQLIHQHLLSHGMAESAATLQREANIPAMKPVNTPLPAPFTYTQHISTPVRGRTSLMSPHPLQKVVMVSNSSSDLASPSTSPLGAGYSVRGGASTPITATTPLRLSLSSRKTDAKATPVACRSLQKQICCEQQVGGLSQNTGGLKECHVTLDSIITEYLTNQHALCKNPMVTCPQFNLFVPHKCPDPKPKNAIPANFAMRLMRGTVSRKYNNRLVHSRFCPVKTIRLGEDDGFFTCCEFLGKDKQLIVGTHHGEVKIFNLHTGSEEATHQCHESYISRLEANRDGTLLLTSSTWRRPLSALWSVNSLFTMKFAMDDDEYVEFSKLTQDRVISTKNEHANVYDITTGQKLFTLTPTLSNQYTKNRATFNPTDELILSDGVLWDVASGKQIHKFDKLNQTLSGVFHPNGLEVVSNTEVWDLRTFHLLRTVPSLEGCEVMFNTYGSTIYAMTVEQEMEEDTSHESSFKTLDALDYANIATIDVKKNIYDLALNRVDTQIAIVENQGVFDSVQESIVRLYDVGRRRDDEDEVEDEEEEEDMDNSDDNSDMDNSDDADVTEGDGGNLQNILDELEEVNNQVAAELEAEEAGDGSNAEDSVTSSDSDSSSTSDSDDIELLDLGDDMSTSDDSGDGDL